MSHAKEFRRLLRHENAEMSSKKTSWYDKVSIMVAEFLGTAILVFVSCLGAITSDIGRFQSSLVAGMAVLIVIHLFGHISGAYVNPVTTVCAFVMSRIDTALACLYFVAQISGGVVGFGLLKLILPSRFSPAVEEENPAFHGAGMTLPSKDLEDSVSTLQIFAIELAVTMVLSLANCSSWDSRIAGNDSLALRFGFLVATLNFIAVPFTGCSMNPARSFGPALWYNDWTLHWVYWTAPLTASLIGSFLYRCLLRGRKVETVSMDDEV